MCVEALRGGGGAHHLSRKQTFNNTACRVGTGHDLFRNTFTYRVFVRKGGF